MNDTRNERTATDRYAFAARQVQRMLPHFVLVGALAALIAAEPIRAQDPRFIRVGAQAPAETNLAPIVTPGMAAPSAVAPGYDYSAYPEDPGYGYSGGWSDTLPADCGMGCPPTWRTRVEAMMMNREGDSGASLSSGFRLGDFDYTEGGRITIGRKYDCSLGWEVTYTGLFEWQEDGVVNAAGTLNTVLTPDNVNLSAFNGANQHAQVYRSRLQSVEVMQKWWGWDVITTSAGVRWTFVDEDFALRSVDANGDIGQFSIETNNHLVGPQLGIDLLFPVDRVSLDTTLKGGLFANIGDSNTFLSNAGVVQFANSADDLEFAAMVEYGTYIRYAVTPRVTLRAGYEFLWIYGLGVAVEQIGNPITPLTGRGFDGTGDTFYHGGTAGIEVVW